MCAATTSRTSRFTCAVALLLFGVIRRTLTSAAAGRGLRRPRAQSWLCCRAAVDAAPAEHGSRELHHRAHRIVDGVFLSSDAVCQPSASFTTKRAAGWQLLAVAACAIGMACKGIDGYRAADGAAVRRYLSLPVASPMRSVPDGGYTLDWRSAGCCLRTSCRRVHAQARSASRPRSRAWTYLLNQAAMIARYLQLAFWPSGLVVDYGPPLPLTLRDVWPQGPAHRVAGADHGDGVAPATHPGLFRRAGSSSSSRRHRASCRS